VTATSPAGLRVLVVDDVAPALDEMCQLLREAPGVASVEAAADALTALRLIPTTTPDAVFLDISMPGMDGLETAQLLARFKVPPKVVFVTAHEQHALEAFNLAAVDYVLKPVREERLAEAVRRVLDAGGPAPQPRPQVTVERAGVTRFVDLADITHVEAQGDYARLHTGGESYLVRTPLSTLEQEWGPAGFVRIHRSLLVSLGHVDEVRMDQGRCSVLVAGRLLAVSRRHTRELRDLLVQQRSGA